MAQWVTLRRDEPDGYKFRFYVDQRPTAIILRKGTTGTDRWQACADLGGHAGTRILFGGRSKRRVTLIVKVLIETGVSAMLEKQATAALRQLERD